MYTALNICEGSVFSSILHVSGCLEKGNRHSWQIQSLQQCLKWCLFSTLPVLCLNASGTLTACCCSFSIANTGSPQRNGLMELGGVHTGRGLERERALSLKLLADTLIPTSNIIYMQVMKTNVWQQFFRSLQVQWIFLWTLPESLISSST